MKPYSAQRLMNIALVLGLLSLACSVGTEVALQQDSDQATHQSSTESQQGPCFGCRGADVERWLENSFTRIVSLFDIYEGSGGMLPTDSKLLGIRDLAEEQASEATPRCLAESQLLLDQFFTSFEAAFETVLIWEAASSSERDSIGQLFANEISSALDSLYRFDSELQRISSECSWPSHYFDIMESAGDELDEIWD